MKIITFGDIHGRDIWKSIDPAEYDRIIFIGDYCDSSDVSDEKEIQNLTEIIELKKSYPDKVVLILGNHDIHYIYFPMYRASRFRHSIKDAVIPLFLNNQNLFQVAYQIDNVVWTHAGMSNKWLDQFKAFVKETYVKDVDLLSIADLLNEVNGNPLHRDILHFIGILRGGKKPHGGITWADNRETSMDIVPGLQQIVGHTQVSKIFTVEKNEGSITFIDCLGNSGQPYIFEHEQREPVNSTD